MVEAGTLYVVPTPIGNLEDITLRALKVLETVDLVACEDTRTSGVLLAHFGIRTPRVSFHAHNEHRRTDPLVDRIESGTSVALVTDAGTPGISDPGFLLVRACVARGVPVVALPGATAFVPALVASGLPCERFVFEGFLPVKKGRRTRLVQLAAETRSIVLYESPHKAERTLADLAEHLGSDRPAALARELTKKFEEVARGTLGSLAAEFASRDRIRGEIVIVVGPAGAAESKPDSPR